MCSIISPPVHTQIHLQATSNDVTTINCLWTRDSSLETGNCFTTLGNAQHKSQLGWNDGGGGMWYLGQHCSYFQPSICLSSEKKKKSACRYNVALFHSAASAHCSKLCALPSLQKLLSLLMRLIKPVQSLFNEAPVAWSMEKTIAGKR